MCVVITGASAGIGAALARELASKGARLALVARRRAKLEALNRAFGGGHLIIEADVSAGDDCKRIVEESAAHFGRIDTLVANAGYGLYETVAGTEPAALRKMFATNVFGSVDCCALAAQVMQTQSPRDGYRGQLMLVSSVAGRRGVPYLGIYSGTKAAQLAIAEAMRVELKPEMIAVTSIHPIMTRTEFGRTAEKGGRIKLPRGGEQVDHPKRRPRCPKDGKGDRVAAAGSLAAPAVALVRGPRHARAVGGRLGHGALPQASGGGQRGKWCLDHKHRDRYLRTACASSPVA